MEVVLDQPFSLSHGRGRVAPWPIDRIPAEQSRSEAGRIIDVWVSIATIPREYMLLAIFLYFRYLMIEDGTRPQAYTSLIFKLERLY